jgi:hypothetical protein
MSWGRIPTRQKALPPYPAIIIGRFDPFRWAADLNRRSDYVDSRASAFASACTTITGFAGAAGRVEGTVRRVDSPEEGHLLRAGEILVTRSTYTAAGLETNGFEHRQLELKGKTEPVDVSVIRVTPESAYPASCAEQSRDSGSSSFFAFRDTASRAGLSPVPASRCRARP